MKVWKKGMYATDCLIEAILRFPLLLVSLYIGHLAAADCWAGPVDQSPKSFSDMVVVTGGEYNNTIFLADPESGGIYSYRVTPESPASLDLSNFQLFFNSEEFPHPTGLAYWNEKLIVCDSKKDEVFEVDLRTKSGRVIYKGKPLEDPSTIAVSASGVIAVSGENSAQIVKFMPQSDRPLVLEYRREIDEPRRLVFVGEELLLLANDRGIYSVAAPNPSRQTSTLEVRQLIQPPAPIDVGARPHDFAYLRGIFYIVNKTRVVAFARGIDNQRSSPSADGNSSATEVIQAENIGRPRLAITNDSLFIGDQKNHVVRRIPRPTPVDVRLEGDADSSIAALIGLYQYLSSVNLLPTATQMADRDYESLEQLLVEKNILISRLSNEARGRSAKTQLEGLICKLNQGLCGSSSPDVGSILGKKVNLGEKMLLPALQLREYITISSVALAGKSVAELLEEQIPSSVLREKYATEDRLAQLNDVKVKEGAADFLKKNTGIVTLPVRRWRTEALVRSEDLKGPDAFLRQLSLSHPGLRLLSKEESAPGANTQSSPTLSFSSREDQDQLLEQVKKNRQLVKSIIHFPSQSLDMSEMKIGMVERRKSVDDQHPDFGTDGDMAWLRTLPEDPELGISTPTESIASSPTPATSTPMSIALAMPNPVAAPERRIRPESDFNTETDHGTHVAGILGARSVSLTPGLLSDVRLFLVDSTSEAEMQSGIDDEAILKHEIFIFNVSQSLDSSGFSNIANKISQQWGRRLFIASAGNDGKDFFISRPQSIPISLPSQNVIGVGAVTTTDHVDEMNLTTTTNFGKNYVHLAAPGSRIFSTTPGNSYTAASGTSQAAPLVTAAAAILFKNNIREPSRIKARLIYTAEWLPQLQNKVWGGLLHVERAIWEPEKNLLLTNTVEGKIRAITFDPNRELRINVRGEQDVPERSDLPIFPTRDIPILNILRITPQSDNRGFRVIFFEFENGSKRLKIVVNARLRGIIRCRAFQELDPESRAFKAPKPCSGDDAYRNGIRVENIVDYIARIPDTIDL